MATWMGYVPINVTEHTYVCVYALYGMRVMTPLIAAHMCTQHEATNSSHNLCMHLCITTPCIGYTGKPHDLIFRVGCLTASAGCWEGHANRPRDPYVHNLHMGP